jgi:hypothetical protein
MLSVVASSPRGSATPTGDFRISQLKVRLGIGDVQRLFLLMAFQFLKGPEAEDQTLYASHTVWENRAVLKRG